MRLLLVLLAGCTTTHTLRAQVVDGETGRMLAGEKLVVHTALASSWCTKTSTDTDGHWFFSSRTTTTTRTSTDRRSTTVRSGRDGWANLPIIEETGICRYSPTEIEVWARRAPIANLDPDERGPLVLPVFAGGGRPRTTAPADPFVALRARAAFAPIDAVRSVYAERFVRDHDRVPVVFSSRDPMTFVVGLDPFDSDPALDGGDPFRRVALATVRGAGLAWRVELRALPMTPTLAYVVPPAFAAQREPIRVWAERALHELVIRRARAASLVDDARWGRKPRVERAALRNHLIAATIVTDHGDQHEVAVVEVPLDPFRSVVLVEHRDEYRGSECRLEWLYHRVLKYLPDHAPPSATCTNGHADGCMLGLDRDGRAWRGSCVVERGVRIARAWPAQ